MKAIFTFIFTSLFLSGTAQTYMYITDAEIIPESPITTSDLVSIRLTGDFSDSGAMVEEYSISLDGFTVTVDITAYSDGGLAVLTPFDITWEMEMYDVGVYDVVITGTGIGVSIEGPLGFEVVEDGTSALPEQPEDPTVYIYPNPSNGMVWVKTTETFAQNVVSVFSLDGTLVMKESLNMPLTQLNLTAFNSGFYIIQVTNQSGSIIKRNKIVVRN